MLLSQMMEHPPEEVSAARERLERRADTLVAELQLHPQMPKEVDSIISGGFPVWYGAGFLMVLAPQTCHFYFFEKL